MNVGVLGAGTMGQGIAQLAASSGADVFVFDRAPAALTELPLRVESVLKRRIEKGQIQEPEAKKLLKRIVCSSEIHKLKDCNLVIEAVTEDLNVKAELFKEIERLVKPETILASNTSSLSITSLGGACKQPSRVIGLHFFNPAPLMALVEVVHAVQSSEESLKSAEDLMKTWGKTPIRVKDTPGFVVNRVARPFYGEALRILDEQIADPATIDWAMQHFGKFRMGPFELMDFIGIDVNYAVTESIFQALYFDSRYRPSISQRRLVEARMLGRKSGQGFYRYTKGAEKPTPRENPELGKRIFERILALLINEAFEAVFWGIATPDAIEKAMVAGVNYPKGLLAWGDEFGLDKVLRTLEALHLEYQEERYRPSVLLKRMVAENKSFFRKA